MGDHQGAARPQVGLDLLAVDAALNVVGYDHHQHVGFFGNLWDVGNPQTRCFGNGPAAAFGVEANHNILSVVLQVEGVGVALAAVADHADGLSFQVL